MNKYIAILRGINVGGQNKLPMASLREKMEAWGFSNVSTYIQSGNLIFEDKKSDPGAIATLIEKNLLKDFSYKVPVIVFTHDYLKKTISKNPFLKNKKIKIDKLHVTFLEAEPKPVNVKNLFTYSYPPDNFKMGEKAVYVYCPEGYGRSKLNNNFFENKLKVKATTRNWKTVNTLLQLAQ